MHHSLWKSDWEQFISVFLHEAAHARFHAKTLAPSDGKVLPPVRSSNIYGLVLGMKDITDEIKADIQKIDWLLVVGKGPVLERLFSLQKWIKMSRNHRYWRMKLLFAIRKRQYNELYLPITLKPSLNQLRIRVLKSGLIPNITDSLSR